MKLHRFWKEETGGIALEATLVMPFFAAILIFAMSLMMLSISQMALESAVSETVKEVSAHLYPVDTAIEAAAETDWGSRVLEWADRIQDWREKWAKLSDMANAYSALVPDSLVEAFQQAFSIPKQWETAFADQWNQALSAAFQPLFLTYADRNVFPGTRQTPHITRVFWPSWRDRENAFFGLEAEYKVELPVPFVHKSVVLRHRAYERIWVGR